MYGNKHHSRRAESHTHIVPIRSLCKVKLYCRYNMNPMNVILNLATYSWLPQKHHTYRFQFAAPSLQRPTVYSEFCAWSRDSKPKISTMLYITCGSPCSSIYYEDMHVLRLQQCIRPLMRSKFTLVSVLEILYIFKRNANLSSYFRTFNNACTSTTTASK